MSSTHPIILDLPELCLRKIFAYLPLCELFRLEQCYPPWLPLIQSVCKCRKQLTIVLSTSDWKIDLQRSEIPYFLRPFNDGISHIDALEPPVIEQVYGPVWQCLPRLDEFNLLTYEWLYEQESNRILSMMPNIRQLTIAVLKIGCYRYIGDYYWDNRLSLMTSIVKLLDHWAPELTKLCLSLSTDNHRATIAEVSEDYRLLIESLNNLPKLDQLALSLQELFFAASDDRIWDDEAKLTNLFYHELNFMPRLTHLYLYVNDPMFHSMFAAELTRADSLEALVLSDLDWVDARLNAVFGRFGSKIVLLPRPPHGLITASQFAKLTNLRSLEIGVAFCTDRFHDTLANTLKHLTRLEHLIQLEMRIYYSGYDEDTSDGPITTSQVVNLPQLDSVRILSLKIHLKKKQWEQLSSESIDWSRLLPSLSVVALNYNEEESYWNSTCGWNTPETLVPLPTNSEGHLPQLCVCERWALQTFDPSRNQNLSALYTRHRCCCSRRSR